jgi:Flp pilus assembly protein TadD
VLAVALAASATSLRNGFVYDDVPIVVEDARIHDLARWRDVARQRYWPAGFGDDQLYRPVTSLSLAVDWRLGHGRPLAFHVVNLALHLAVVALVIALAGRFLPPAAALVAALWFAVHPVHVEAVANVVGRSELLAALGYLAAILAYDAGGGAGVRGARRFGFGAVVFLGTLWAVGSKEHGLTLPAALLLVDAARARATREGVGARLRRSWPMWLAAAGACAVFLAVRATVVGPGFDGGQVAAGLEGKSALQRFFVMLPGNLAWARLLLVPIRLSADYSPDAIRPLLRVTPQHAAGMVLVVGTLAAAWALRRRAPAATLGLAWVVVTASVAANVVVPTGVLVAERSLYLPSVGAALVCGALWALVPPARGVWPATAAVVALLGARSVERVRLWGDNTRFFERLAQDAPDSYKSHWMRGAWEFRRGRFAPGEQLYLEAIRIYPYDATLVAELGSHYLDAGAYAPADRFLTMALRMDSTLGDATLRAIVARTGAGRGDSAAALAAVAVQRFPNDRGILLAAIPAELAAGSAETARLLALHLVAQEPSRWEFLQIAGDAAARAGRCDQARDLVQRARRAAPAGEPAPGRLLQRFGAGPRCGLEGQ